MTIPVLFCSRALSHFLRLWLVPCLLLGCWPSQAAEPNVRIRPGMTSGEIVTLLGAPKRVARQILYRRYLETWTYDRPLAIRIEFNCVKGQDPIVVNVHSVAVVQP